MDQDRTANPKIQTREQWQAGVGDHPERPFKPTLEDVVAEMGMEPGAFRRKYLTDAPFYALVTIHLATLTRQAERQAELEGALRELGNIARSARGGMDLQVIRSVLQHMARVVEAALVKRPTLEEVQRRGYLYGPGEHIPGDEADTAREW